MVEEDKTFEEAYERLKKASSDEKLMTMYRSREKAIRDWNDSINSARREGELDWQFTIFAVNTGWFLIRVTAIFQFQFFHDFLLYLFLFLIIDSYFPVSMSM